MGFPIRPEELDVSFLTEALGACAGDIRSARADFVGDAIGNTSDVYFVRMDVRDGADLPETLVAKMIPRFDGAIEVCKTLRLFEREIENYRTVASRSPIRVPKLIWSDYDPATSLGIMILEDCSHFDSFDQTRPVPSSLKDLEKIFDSAADLHAAWWDSAELRDSRILLQPGHPVRQRFAEMVAGGWESLLTGGPGAETIPEAGKQIARTFADSVAGLWEWLAPKDQLTVMHLDFRIDNIFFDRVEDRPVIFDWQGASVGRGAYDLAYLMATGYEPAFRRRHELQLLQRYYRRLQSAGVSGYSFDELEQDYVFGLMHSLWVVPFTAILDLSSKRGQALVDKIIGGIFTAISDRNADAVFESYLASQQR